MRCTQALSPTDTEAQLEFKRKMRAAFVPLIDFQALLADPEVAQGLTDPQVGLQCTESGTSSRVRPSEVQSR